MPAPDHRSATGDDAGRTCPYCRFPVKSGAAVVGCGDCGAVHHDDCWVEGEGCAVVGCTGGPGGSGAGRTAGPAGTAADDPGPDARVPARHAGAWTDAAPAGSGATAPHDTVGTHDEPTLAHHAAASPWGTPPPPQTSQGSDRHGVLIASILVLAVAVVGSAAAVLLLSGGKDDGRPVAATTTRRADTVADRPATTATRATAPTPTAPGTTSASPTTTGSPVADGQTTGGSGATAGGSGSGSAAGGPADDPAPGDGLLSATPFHGGGFLISPPAGRWVRDSTEKLKGDLAVDGFYETRWHLSGRPDVYVLVDRAPGSTDSPRSGAARGRAKNDGAADYVEHAYGAVGGDFVWEFSSQGRHKYDRFSRSCDNGYAAFGATAEGDWATYGPTVRAFAASLRPTC